MRHKRATVSLERGRRDGDRYRFGMVLATEGEASDGHILSIRGGEIPARMPLLAVHDDYNLEHALGSVVEPQKDLRADVPLLRTVGEINLDGEGDAADARRDVANLVEAGDVSAVSIRWDAIESVRRINLPGDHPAFVDAEKETSLSKRYGLFFRRWRALEGSVVAIGADAAAKITERANEWQQKGRAGVATFMRGLVHADNADATAAELVAEGMRQARARGVASSELLEAVADELELVRVTVGDEQHYAPRAVARALDRVSRPAPANESRRHAAALTVDDLGRLLSQHDKRLERAVEQMLARALGQRGTR